MFAIRRLALLSRSLICHAAALVLTLNSLRLEDCPNKGRQMPKRSYECEFPECHNYGSLRTINAFGQGRRTIANLCDEHYKKARKSDPEVMDRLISKVWPKILTALATSKNYDRSRKHHGLSIDVSTVAISGKGLNY
jgi:hypothetical protein